MKIECVLTCDNHLGEGPVWDVEEGRLYWVDGTGQAQPAPNKKKKKDNKLDQILPQILGN